ncbi:hypothetical protein CR155_16320 [Pollutimonas nitritireducens]|uniref:DUF4148 domain-containing protein n=2 Tax=Pollutimonas nitritireducens TaxID=2045209 RepID=A0A2N4UD73_9BURK|nr:hypothetical protein CR155_16320 [Pollutimonas nitritireducens]
MEFCMKIVITGLMISFSLVIGAAQAAHVDAPASIDRAQVVAELQEARTQGLLSHGELDYPAVSLQPASSKTRQEVRSELFDARAAGTLSHGELDYPIETPVNSSKTRAEVQAELAAYKAAGHIQPIPN